MPLTTGGIYYADENTPMSIADITAAMATSVSNSLSVLQLVTASQDNDVTTTSTTQYVSSGLSASITPSSVDSQIIVLVNLPYYSYDNNSPASPGGNFRLLRNSIVINSSSLYISNIGRSSFFFDFTDNMTMNYVDSPATTAPVTYSITGKAVVSNYSSLTMNGSTSTITLLEIGKSSYTRELAGIGK